jgi:XTP/dITP diphosphohydrolase
VSRPVLVFATSNLGKVAELEALLAGVDVEIRSARDVDIPDVVEDLDNFAGNAQKKAREVSAALGLPALADDSGLCVDALDGAPGVWSARYAGPGASDADNNEKLLAELDGLAPGHRTARFRSALALADVRGALGDQVIVCEGTCEGVILEAPRGDGGFGYDPLFYVPELGATFAELGVGTKNDRSHRARAMRLMRPRLVEVLLAKAASPG